MIKAVGREPDGNLLSFDQESLVADPTQPVTGNMQVIDRKQGQNRFEGRILMEFEDPAERSQVMTAAYCLASAAQNSATPPRTDQA